MGRNTCVKVASPTTPIATQPKRATHCCRYARGTPSSVPHPHANRTSQKLGAILWRGGGGEHRHGERYSLRTKRSCDCHNCIPCISCYPAMPNSECTQLGVFSRGCWNWRHLLFEAIARMICRCLRQLILARARRLDWRLGCCWPQALQRRDAWDNNL